MRYSRRRRKTGCIKLAIAATLAALTFAYISLESQITQGLIDLTNIKAEELCNNAVNTAVLNVLENDSFVYDDFVTVKAADSSVTNISTNTVTANKFKSLVSLKAQEEIGNMSGMEINYRLGDFSNLGLLSGRGPELIVQIYLSASVTSDLESTFDSCGINQTKHTLNIVVTSNVYITSEEGFDTYKTVITRVPIAENIIVGSTPSVNIQSST